MCSDELPAAIAKQGFKGAQSMPRKINYEPETKTLRSYPVKEMQQLRGKQVRYSNQQLCYDVNASAAASLCTCLAIWLQPVGHGGMTACSADMTRSHQMWLHGSCTQPQTQQHLISWQSQWTLSFTVLLLSHLLLPCL